MRTTNQQTIIKAVLKKYGGHRSAEEVFHKVRRRLPQISLATVYRNLKRLTELGEVKRLFVNGKTLYESDHGIHSHFICCRCGKIEDIEIQQETLLATLKRKGYKTESLDIIATGVCKACSKS